MPEEGDGTLEDEEEEVNILKAFEEMSRIMRELRRQKMEMIG